MRRILVSVLFVLTAGIPHSIATPLAAHWDNMHVKHAQTWTAVPANWECLGDPSAGITIDLRIALRPHRENGSIDALYEASDTRHARYGAHLSKEQVAEIVAPSLDTLELVNSWLKHHGVSPSSISRTHDGGCLTVSSVPVSRANEMLGASYQLHWHAGTNDDSPHGPLYIACSARRTRADHRTDDALHLHAYAAADSTHPLQWSSGMAREGASGEPKDVLSPRDVRVTPVFLRVLYGTVKYEPAAIGRNVLGVTGYLGQYPSPVYL